MTDTTKAELAVAQQSLVEETNRLMVTLAAGEIMAEPIVYAYHRYRMANERFDRLARGAVDREVLI